MSALDHAYARIAELEAEREHAVYAYVSARITELEAANAVCRRDIEALMSSCDKLESMNTKLEAERDKLKAEKQATWDRLISERNIFSDLKAELEAERDNLLTDVDGLTVDRDAAEAERDEWLRASLNAGTREAEQKARIAELEAHYPGAGQQRPKLAAAALTEDKSDG